MRSILTKRILALKTIKENSNLKVMLWVQRKIQWKGKIGMYQINRSKCYIKIGTSNTNSLKLSELTQTGTKNSASERETTNYEKIDFKRLEH